MQAEYITKFLKFQLYCHIEDLQNFLEKCISTSKVNFVAT